MAKKIYLEWSEIHECVKILCKGLFMDYPNIDSVMGLPRGGLIPAVMISHELGLPYVIHPGKNTLVVDDINDTGATFNWIVDDWEKSCMPGDTGWRDVWCENVRFAVLTDNSASDFKFMVNYSTHEVNKKEEDIWLVYPWERVGTYD